LIGEVIHGEPLIEQRLFGSIGTVQRIRLDLRYALDRSTYGNILTLTIEVDHYLNEVGTSSIIWKVKILTKQGMQELIPIL